MSNRRKAAAAPTRPADDEVPVLSLEHWSAQLLEKPGAMTMVKLHLGGMDVSTGASAHTDFVMLPEHARAIIGELRRALPD